MKKACYFNLFGNIHDHFLRKLMQKLHKKIFEKLGPKFPMILLFELLIFIAF